LSRLTPRSRLLRLALVVIGALGSIGALVAISAVGLRLAGKDLGVTEKLRKLAGAPEACRPPSAGRREWLSVEPMFDGRRFRKPVQAIQDPSDPDVWFVAESEGRVLRIDGEEATVALDIRDRVSPGEQWGLQGFALPPGYPEDARLFVTYTAEAINPEDALQARVAVFRSRDRGRTFDPKSEQVLLAEGQKNVWHSIAGLRFGPDGKLYVAWGEGSAVQSDHEDAYLRGMMLRLDVSPEQGGAYAVPPDNPFVKGPYRPEVWAAGFRNPWRFSFDTKTGDLWVGDVGSRRFEEIDVVKRGAHYGWPRREGFDCLWADGCPQDTLPVHVHPAQTLCSIIGGWVYRGKALPSLQGKYVYGDYCARTLYAFDPETKTSELVAQLPIEHLASIETDRDGELYVVEASGRAGDPETIEEEHRVYRVVATADPAEAREPRAVTLASRGCQSPAGASSPPPEMLSYRPTVAAWDEGASAVRFVGEDFRRLDAIDDALVGRPKVYLKTLSVDGTPVETQMLSIGWKGEWGAWSFAWDDAGKTARLVTKPTTRTLPNRQEWRYDTAPACFRCHNEAAGRILGLTPRQLDGVTASPSQLERWLDEGLVEGPEDRARLLDEIRRGGRLVDPADASQPLEARVRSYLHVSCGPCHRPGGETASARIDLTEEGSLAALVGLRASAEYPELPEARIVDPGRPESSLLYRRLAATDSLAMPPGRVRADPVGTAIVAEWIRSLGTG